MDKRWVVALLLILSAVRVCCPVSWFSGYKANLLVTAHITFSFHLLSIRLTKEQVKSIHNQYCFLT